MIPAIVKSFAVRRAANNFQGGAYYGNPNFYGSPIPNEPRQISMQTYVVIFLIIGGLLWYALGRKATVNVEGSKAKGEGATLTSSQAANHAHNLETYFNSGWVTTTTEFNAGLKIIEQLSEADLLAVANSYSKSKYGYDTLRALLNAQYITHRSSADSMRMSAAIEKLSKAGL